MRIFLWIAAVGLGVFFLMAALPWIFMKEFRDSSWGREFRLIIVVIAVLLAIVISNLVKL